MFSCLLPFRHLTPLAPSDVIVLEYLANGEEVKKLKGNEKVSINFPNKLKSFTRKQVSPYCETSILSGRTELHKI
jgi:hypothetical protein